MKKSVVVLLIVLALVVLVSPGIVGRLAEQTMDENLDWAATGNEEVNVTATRFDRGWFSSAGQHRIEIRDPELRELALFLVGGDGTAGVPALVIDTQLDHGLIPVTSMARENGSLLPGLGSAVSTLRLEFPNGEVMDVPGRIFSRVGITGELATLYEVEPGSLTRDDGRLSWGSTRIALTSNPVSGRLVLDAALEPLSVTSREQTVSLGRTRLDMDQQPGRFGLPVGDLDITVDSLGLSIGPDSDSMDDRDTATVGPLSIRTSTSEDGERALLAAALRFDNAMLEPLGNGTVIVELNLDAADGRALASLQRSLEQLATNQSESAGARLHADARRLLATGFDLDLTRLDIELPAGVIEATSRVSIAATDPASFSWAGALLASDARLDLSLPEAVVDLLTTLNPQVNAAIALGYLRRDGDRYRVEATLADGLFTINGAPMQLPPGAFR